MRLCTVILCMGLLFAKQAAAMAADAIEILSEPQPDGIEIVIDKMKYLTPEITVSPGQTVTWVNREVLQHNVHFRKGEAIEKDLKGPMPKRQQTFTVRFNTQGTYNYICTPHPAMKGKVIVE